MSAEHAPGCLFVCTPVEQLKTLQVPWYFFGLLAGHQLNVDANKKQACEYNMEHGTHRLLVLMFSMAQAHLLLPDGTVTGRYTNVLFHEASAKPLLEYIRHKML